MILTPYVVRDQSDLRAIFERKMQERQEFLDRYFVFNEDQAWEPPKDFSRANGLVETIRQTMLDLKDKERLENEARPRGTRTHEPVEPISLPSIGSAPKSGSTSVGSDSSSRPDSTSSTSKEPSRGKLKPSTGIPKIQTPTPPSGGDRVE